MVAHYASTLFGAHGEYAHHNQCQRPQEYVDKGGKLRLAVAQAAPDGKGNRHAYAKQEGGEYGVRKAKHIFIPLGMALPVGNALQGGNVVYEEHEKHGERAHHIDSSYALGGLGSHLSFVFSFIVCKFSTIIRRRHLIIARLGLNSVGARLLFARILTKERAVWQRAKWLE